MLALVIMAGSGLFLIALGGDDANDKRLGVISHGFGFIVSETFVVRRLV